jgi:sigma-B regulation protein RsbU (phosphoserine phosphatase)
MSHAHVQVILADDAVPEALRAALTQIGVSASFWRLGEALQHDATKSADAIVLVTPTDTSGIARPLRLLFDRLAERPRAMLVLTADGGRLPLELPAAVPVTYGRRHAESDLATRLAVLLEMRPALDTLHRGLLATRRSGQNTTRRYIGQLRLAGQVQRQFLPEALPVFGRVTCDVLFRPVDYVSGDIYDVHRLDEDHVGIALADASGHGIPAALLTVYIKRALRGKEIEHGRYRILAPDEVLTRLNEDLVDAQLTECPFVAAVYAVLNTRTLELSLARGGAPFPLLRTADGEVHAIESPGGVVGVAPGESFVARQVQLEPGDSVLIYTDGIERLLAPQPVHGQPPVGLTRAVERLTGVRRRAHEQDDGDVATATLEPVVSTLACPADPATDNPWLRTLSRCGVDAALRQLDRRQRTLRRMGCPLDDLTVLALRVTH